MPLRKVQFYPGEFYHVYNRGYAKQDVFYNDGDRYRFLQAMYLSNNSNYRGGLSELEKNEKGYALADIKEIFEDKKISYNPLVKISADVLMPNHFHLLIEELQEKGISRFMQKLGNSYGKYFAIKYDRPGSLFQGRFKAVHIEKDDQLRYLLAYINAINPAQLIEPKIKEIGIKDFEKILKGINKYSWSTHFEYMGKRESAIIDKGLLGKIFPTPEIYYEFVKNVLHGKEDMWSGIDGLTLD